MKSNNIFYDLRSGLVVFLVALPLCLGVAMASKVPVMSGLLGGIIGGIVIGLISNSRFSVSGPAAGLTGIMSAAVVVLDYKLELLFISVMIAGVIQIIFGLFKAGIIANFFPSSAIKGMLCGIGIILIVKQIPHFFGYDMDPEGDLDFFKDDNENTFSEIYKAIGNIGFPSLIIGSIGLFILIIWETKYFKNNKLLLFIPAPLIVVASGILFNYLFTGLGNEWTIAKEHIVDFPNIIENGTLNLQILSLTDFSALSNPIVYQTGLVIALVASIETLLCIEAIDRLDPEHNVTNQNRELFAQGIGNITSGFFGGLPLTSVIVRSSANLNAGAKTKNSTIFHGIFLMLTILIIPFVLKMIPNSSLAAILIFTGYKLARISIFKNAFRQGWKYYIPFLATIVVMLVTDLLKGVGVGMVLAFVFILIENMQIPFRIGYEKFDNKIHILIQVSQHITFLHKTAFIKALNRLPENSHLVIDARKTRFMDRDVTELLNEFKAVATHKNITVEFLNIKEVETLAH